MTPTRRFAGIVLLALALSVAAPAQEPDRLSLTLEDCLRLALEKNPMHLASLEKIEGAQSQLRRAASGFFPQLTASGLYTMDEKLFTLEFPSFIPGQPPQRVALDFTKDYQFSMSLNVPLFTGGRLVSAFKQAQDNLKATRETVRQSRQDTIYNVTGAFYGFLLAKEFAAVSEEALALAEKHFQNVKNLYEVGMASKFDLLRAEVQVTNLMPSLLRARNGLTQAEAGLKTLLGLDLEQPVTFTGVMEFVPLEPDLENCTAAALLNRPELNQMLYQKRMAAEMVKMSRAAGLPTVAISGAFNYWADAFDFRKNTWQDYYSINLVFSLPLFTGFSTSAQVGQSKSLLRELEQTHRGMVDMVKLEVRQAILNLNHARETLRSQEKNVEQAEESVRIAELNYSEGLATSLDVNSVQVALAQARTNRSQALYDYVMSQAQLRRAMGAEDEIR
ncbi:MAG: TolC family protein [Candidatus Aminicenantes bacterium]|nr:TolC family protein [Candidatus Aminicenantes bacterium]